jgi:hypothetical protein
MLAGTLTGTSPQRAPRFLRLRRCHTRGLRKSAPTLIAPARPCQPIWLEIKGFATYHPRASQCLPSSVRP